MKKKERKKKKVLRLLAPLVNLTALTNMAGNTAALPCSNSETSSQSLITGGKRKGRSVLEQVVFVGLTWSHIAAEVDEYKRSNASR